MSRVQKAFPIVGIGASAGAIEALTEFFKTLPADTGCGFVIVVHVSPDRKSLLDEVMSRMTPMPVEFATHDVEVRPNAVYIAPAGVTLGIAEGRLRLLPPASADVARRPIDLFLNALAKDQTHDAVAIILSGANADGALGVKAIKEHGGFTMAQIADGHPPAYPEMPNQAILTGMVDIAAPVGDMARHLVGFASMVRAPVIEPQDPDALRSEACAILKARVGYDFSRYKTKSIDRRVQRRMQALGVRSSSAYLERLRSDPAEVANLFRDLLIGVTSFFRDPDAFKVLQDVVIPKILRDRSPAEAVRVWAPGCSTGEEAYSLAILFHEATAHLPAPPKIQIFATDIDDAALSVARAGSYPVERLDGVSEERRRAFFVNDADVWTVTKDIRNLCVFSVHSVLKDPPFSQMDLVCCRNLLIYFSPAAQDDVIPIFRYALRQDGHLFLGASENISRFATLFAPIDKKSRVFEARSEATLSMRPAPSSPREAFQRGLASRPARGAPQGLAAAVANFVSENLSPPHVVITAEGDIVLYSTRTGQYFETPAGAPSLHLFAMARKGLRLPLRGLLTKVRESGKTADFKAAEIVLDDGRVQQVRLTISPLPAQIGGSHYLVVFENRGQATESDAEAAQRDDEARVERDLRDMQDRLQSMIEEYETALEELKVSNEELLSVNEELQSANEELESSKEEMQSVNEELHTVNAELSDKLDALDRANGDLRHMLESSSVATIFLDFELLIRMYTPCARSLFRIIESDVGRPLTDLSNELAYDDLATDLVEARNTGTVVERKVKSKADGRTYDVRIAPNPGNGRSIGGLVVAISRALV